MPRITDINLFAKREQPCLVVKGQTSVRELPALIDDSYGRIFSYIGESGMNIADFPFVGYFNMDMENLVVEIGVPVASALVEKDGMVMSLVPSGLVVSTLYQGPYMAMEGVYQEMNEWIAANGLVPAGPVYEYYLNGPEEYPEAELLTRIVMLVKKAA